MASTIYVQVMRSMYQLILLVDLGKEKIEIIIIIIIMVSLSLPHSLPLLFSVGSVYPLIILVGQSAMNFVSK